MSRLEREGIEIDGRTATPYWFGERLNLAYAIDVLWRPRPDVQPRSDVSAETSRPSL